MVLYIGNEPIAGYSTNTKMNAHSLLDFKFCDHILNELSWVNADTFSWLSGDVYTAVYNKLVAEYDTGTSETETGVSYKKSDNGFKIADASQEQAVINAYNSTGVAWFYILDTTNRRFKLPRTKYNKYMSQVAVKGNGMTLGMTDGVRLGGCYESAGSPYEITARTGFYGTNVGSSSGSGDMLKYSVGITTDASKSGMVADLSTDTNMLLYFYVGEFAQSAIEQTAGYAQTLTEKKADINLSNSTAITNCITEIPQDIKLELNNGTLTLKAGSKVYVPNGAGVFDVVTIDRDFVINITWTAASKGFVYYQSENTQSFAPLERCSSGTVAPTQTDTRIWYDTTENKVKRYYSGAVNRSDLSFPIAIVSIDSTGAVLSIDQVFNGFGYIGSTVFALPNVKGLIPNGRNADGTLNNIEFTIDAVKINTKQDNWTQEQEQFINASRLYGRIIGDHYYDEVNNYNKLNDGTILPDCGYGSATLTAGKISNFTPKTNFHALDYNDKPTISGWSMPSNRYRDLTLGASNTDYIASANGYVLLQGQSTASGQFVRLYNRNQDNTANIESTVCHATSSGQYPAVILPVKKGKYFRASYDTGGASKFFRLVYAEGEN